MIIRAGENISPKEIGFFSIRGGPVFFAIKPSNVQMCAMLAQKHI